MLTLPFRARDRAGHLTIEMRRNDDPYATGHDEIASNFDAERFKGFPVVTAEMDYPGEGPAGWFGWIQLIRQVRDGRCVNARIDANPLLGDTPLYVVGYHPTFADAPANPDHHDLDWRADAFLVEIRSRCLSPVVGFGWGYRRFVDDRTELIAPAKPDDQAWQRIGDRLEQDHPGWTTTPDG